MLSCLIQCALTLCFSLLGPVAHALVSSGAAEQYTRQIWNSSSGLPQDTVRQFLQTRDGYLWMATDGGLVRFDGAELTSFNRRTLPAMQSDLVNALLEDTNGNLWVATSDGLIERKDNHFRRFSIQNGLPSDAVLCVNENAQGQVCASTASGTACLNNMSFQARDTNVGAVAQLPVAKSSDGTTWTPDATGLSRLSNGVSSSIPMPEGFTGTDILTLYLDHEGDLWVGSATAGAAVLRKPAFETLGRKQGLAADQVRSLSRDATGDLWFGTSAGLTRLHGGNFSTITVKDGLASDEIIALAGDSSGDLWAGTPDGLSHLQNGTVTNLTAADGLPDDNIRSLLAASDHSLWIGTTHGLAHLLAPPSKTIRTYTTADGVASNVIGALLEDADGGLWIGTRDGLSHLHNGVIQSYGAKNGLKSSIITALARDAGGTLWVGTSGGGLYEWNGGHLLHAQTQNPTALPDTVYGILEDAQKQIWISSPDGIYRTDQASLHALAEGGSSIQSGVLRYDVADGLRINDCGSGGHPEAIHTADGRLLFATSKGASVVDPAALAIHPLAPPVAIESVLIDDRITNVDAALRVPAGNERVAFQYTGLSFKAPSKVRYRYQLEPFDRGWIDAGARRTAYYTNIPPGRYVFRVLASIDGSTWSATQATVDVTIAPHYYQTWWFYCCLFTLVALIIWQLYLYRLRQVELRFDAVLAERGRIAREIHDTLAQDIVAISVQLDLISRLMTLSVEKALEQLASTRDLVRKSLAEARSSIWDLRSPATGANDLPTRLREVTRQVVGDAPVALNLQITGTYRPSSRDLEDELLRIAQEATTNAVRHAEANVIEVSLNYHATGVELRVHDDGRGFTMADPKSGPPGHYGLRGMHERAERARARLTIRSQPGAGTTVQAEASIS